MKIKQQKFEVKYYWSPDIYDPWRWKPNDDSVFYLLEMNIGITGENESDIYSIIIATPQGIINRDRRRFTKKILLIDQYDWNKVRSAIDEKLANIKPSDGQQAYDKLASIFDWEYECMTLG